MSGIGIGISPVFQSVALGFLPTDISNLQLWLDADDISTLFTDSAGTIPVTSDGDVVGKWDDKSGNGNHVIQATTAKKPLYKTSIQNSLPIVRTDGVDDVLEDTTFPDFDDIISVFVAVTVQDKINSHIVRLNTDAQAQIVGLFVDSTTPFFFRAAAGGGNVDITEAVSEPFTVIASYVFSTSSAEGFFDQVSVGSAANPGTFNSAIGRLAVGASNSSGDLGLQGDLMEIIVYNATLSSADRILVENYLNNKLAIF